MESAVSQAATSLPGAEIACLLGDARLKNALHFRVASVNPFVIEGASFEVKKFSFPRPAVLIAPHGKVMLRGEGEVISVEHSSDGRARLYFTKIEWEEMERRQYPRISLNIPVKIRAVYETANETIISVVEGVTEDLSIGGSKVHATNPVLVGSLVEFDATVNELDRIRALGVVVQAENNGMLRISFMDYLGATRHKLNELTRFKAA